MIGFFLPGDSLLVTAGLFAAKGDLDISTLNVALILAAIIGDAARLLDRLAHGPGPLQPARTRSSSAAST